MIDNAVLLARVQFAFTMAFHIVFPSFTIGLVAWIAALEALWLSTGRDRYYQLARFWAKIFAISFAMGVVSGLVMSYQLGTNWSRFSRTLGNIIGPMIGYEVVWAFFLEATFLGIMLFGWTRVPRALHFAATVSVVLGTTMSAFWILSANSWMHTPAGFEMRDGVAYPVDWVAIIFNPSFPYRLGHMMIASYLTVAFVVARVGARYTLEGRHSDCARTMLRMGLGLALILAPLQTLIGDMHGLNTLAGEDRRHRSSLGERRPRTAGLVCAAEREDGAQRLRSCDPLSRQPDPFAQSHRRDSGAQGLPVERPSSGDSDLLFVPDHGRSRVLVHLDGRRRRRLVAAS
jgi:cytochrome d ubiquinol oxidase subunit I